MARRGTTGRGPAKKDKTPGGRRAPARPAPRKELTEGEGPVLAKIALIPEPFGSIGRRLHAIIRASAPELHPRTWYGLPAYAKDGEVVCFFRGPQVFKERYLTLGFNDGANLDDGPMWAVQFALKELTPMDEARIAAMVRKAVS